MVVCLDLSQCFKFWKQQNTKKTFGLFMTKYQQYITTFSIVTGKQRLEEKGDKQAQNTKLM